jgi:hypothetical protein
MDPPRVDLLVDLAEIDSVRDVRILLAPVRSALRSLVDAGEWNTVAVISGAFPADLRDFAPWTLGEVPREDAALWTRLAEHFDGLSFGDYTVSHPALSLGSRSPRRLNCATPWPAGGSFSRDRGGTLKATSSSTQSVRRSVITMITPAPYSVPLTAASSSVARACTARATPPPGE